VRKLWKKFGILVTGYDAEKSRREFEAVKEAFEALPKPKNEIPSTLRKVKW
jgi:hypothetical protein